MRNPARTSSITSAAPIRSARARAPRAKAGSTSSWSSNESCLNGVTMIAATSPSTVAAAASRDSSELYANSTRSARSLGVVPAGEGVHQGSAPWYAPCAISTLFRPVAALATMRAWVVASVPFLENIAQSALGIRSTSSSASSTMIGPGPLRQSPSAAWRAAASSTRGCRWPSTTGPQLHMKSMYSRPFTSHWRQPSPRSKNCGKPGANRAALRWPYMPPGTTLAARARRSASFIGGSLGSSRGR